AKHGRGRLLRRRFAGDQLLQRLEIPVALLQRRGGRLEALVTAGRRLFDQSDDGLRALLRVVDPLFPQLHRIGQDALDLDELVETERAADRVVQLRRAVLEQRAELVVGKEGAAGLERALPVERLERARLLSRRDDRRLAVFQLVAGPPAAHNERALTFDDELGADGAGTVVVQVAPAVDPGLRATVPAEVAPGQQELECLGKARLPAAVAADDEREAGTGTERERGGRADSAEAADGDRRDVHAGRLAGSLFVAPRPLRRRRLDAVVEEPRERFRAFQRGQEDERPRFAVVAGLIQ